MVITWSGLCSSHKDSVWKVLEAQQTTASLGKDKQLETGRPMVDLLGVCPGHHLRAKMSPRGFGQDLDGDTSVGLKIHLARLAAGRGEGRWLGSFRRERGLCPGPGGCWGRGDGGPRYFLDREPQAYLILFAYCLSTCIFTYIMVDLYINTGQRLNCMTSPIFSYIDLQRQECHII